MYGTLKDTNEPQAHNRKHNQEERNRTQGNEPQARLEISQQLVVFDMDNISANIFA
jgi:hypothetical protein